MKTSFENKSDFYIIHFLDNFYENVDLDMATEDQVISLLESGLQNDNAYIKRTSFSIISDLSASNTFSNPYLVLPELHKMLNSTDPILKVVAIKNITRFEALRTDSVKTQLKEFTDDANGDVASESFFALGIMFLTELLAERSEIGLVSRLSDVKSYFQGAKATTENRDDASFYLSFIGFIESTLSDDVDQATIHFGEFEDNLRVRNLYEFDSQNLELDFLVFRMLNQVKKNFFISSRSNRWIDFRVEVNELFQVHEQLKAIKETAKSNSFLIDRLYSISIQTVEESIYKQYLSSKKEALGALRDKISEEGESELTRYLRSIINLLPQTEEGKLENPNLLALLSQTEGSEKGLRVYNEINDKKVSSEVLNTFSTITQKYKSQTTPCKTGSRIGEEVYYELRCEIESNLPNYSDEKMEIFFNIVEEVIRYARATFVNNDRKRFPFIYTKTPQFPNGKGDKASERDLQDSMLLFFETSKIMDGLEHEKARFVDGGRVDIVYEKDIITIPIELKKSLKSPSTEDLEDKYMAQTQTYTSGYDQLGIFVLLELSDKQKGVSPNFKDWFRVHHIPPKTNLDIKYPDYVISLVIPGNKTSPSTKSTYG